MSSRLFLPEDARPSAPVVWREVRPGDTEDRSASVALQQEHAAQIAQLEQQHQQRVCDAHASGIREGEEAGRKRGAAEVQPVVDRLSRSISELAQLRPRLRREAEADMIKLALAIARRVLRRELAIDPEALHGLVLAALEKLEGQEVSRVRVHPLHVAQVTATLRQSAAGASIEVSPDGSCAVGGVVFETARGNLDASLETQLQEIERGLADRLRRS
jgi:flagellar assembly protein FliH